MRAREILQEDYNQNLESDLNNLLVVAKGSGANQVRTQDIVSQLYNMGYAVNVNSIMQLLSRNPAVLNATPEMIKMTEPDGMSAGGGDAADNSAEKVSDMAQSAVDMK